MQLRPVVFNAFLTAEYDAQDGCLFIQLQSLADAPAALPTRLPSLEALLAAGRPARCLVQTSFATALPASHLHWLLDWLLPQLFEAGATQWLWVCQAASHSYRLLEQVRHHLPYIPLTTFCDVEQAVTWRWQTRVVGSAGLAG